MIVDSSAVVAILLREPRWQRLLDALAASATQARIGTPTLVETGIVLAARLGIPGKSLLARFQQEADLEPVTLGEDHWPIAVDAYIRFGKGRHPAGLNFGDCLTYAVAKLANEPLLCSGEDFAKTDLVLVEI